MEYLRQSVTLADEGAERELDTQQFVELMFDDGAVMGLVVLGATFPSSRAPCGFYTDREAFLATAAELSGHGNVYVSINELDHSLLERGENQFNAYARQRFSGGDVVRRRTLVIDLDPERPSGTNSTEEELRAAVAKAKQVSGFLRERWGVEPLVMISGNGTQLLYKIDEPTESDLVGRVLAYLDAEFSDEVIKVDTSLSDAPRITRLPGTLNMKGEPTDERPQRYASVLMAPERLEVVTTEQLESLLPTVDASTDAAKPSRRLWTHEKVRRMLEEQYASYEGRGWKYREKTKRKDAYDNHLVYEIEQCPFVEHAQEHAYRAMLWLNNGVLCYKCFSPDCCDVNKKTAGDFLRKIAPSPEESPTDERRLARVFLDQYAHPDAVRLRHHKGQFWEWDDGWRLLPDEVVNDRLYAACKSDLDRLALEEAEQNGGGTVARVTNALLGNVKTAVKSLVSLDLRTAPCWVDDRREGEFIAFSDSILDLTAWIGLVD